MLYQPLIVKLTNKIHFKFMKMLSNLKINRILLKKWLNGA